MNRKMQRGVITLTFVLLCATVIIKCESPIRNSTSNNKLPLGKSITISENDNERDNNYLIKFLTPYTVYPVRLKDHYGRNSHTQWLKYGCQCYVDELENSSAHFSTEIDQYDDGQTTVHLLLLNFNVVSTNFLLDHYEPKHSKSRPKNESNLDYQYFYEDDTNIEPEIYTLVYLNQFNLIKNNDAADSAELSCKVSLLLPSGIVNEQSVALNEKLNQKLALKFNLHEPNDHVYTASGKSKRSIRVRSAEGRKRINKRQAADNKPTLYEIEIIEGPIKLFKSNFKDGLNASCSLSLKDFDDTFAFNSFINSTIFSSSQRILVDRLNVDSSSSSSSYLRCSSSGGKYVTTAWYLLYFSIICLLTVERR